MPSCVSKDQESLSDCCLYLDWGNKTIISNTCITCIWLFVLQKVKLLAECFSSYQYIGDLIQNCFIYIYTILCFYFNLNGTDKKKIVKQSRKLAKEEENILYNCQWDIWLISFSCNIIFKWFIKIRDPDCLLEICTLSH